MGAIQEVNHDAQVIEQAPEKKMKKQQLKPEKGEISSHPEKTAPKAFSLEIKFSNSQEMPDRVYLKF